MNKYKDQKEFRMALNGKMINLMAGIFILLTAVTSTLSYSLNFFTIASEVAAGNEEIISQLAGLDTSVMMLRTAGVALGIVAAAEIFVGVLALRLNNRLQKAGFIFKSTIVLIVLEVILHVMLFAIGLPNLGMLFNGLLMPACLIWSSTRFMKLAKLYPDKVFAMEQNKNNYGKQGQKPKKSLMDRAKIQSAETKDEQESEN